AAQVRLVDESAVRRDCRGTVPGGEAMRRVVEADKLRSVLRCEAHLSPEPRPQTLPAPPDLIGEVLDPRLAAGAHHPAPCERDLGIQPSSGLAAADERLLRDGEPLVPRP